MDTKGHTSRVQETHRTENKTRSDCNSNTWPSCHRKKGWVKDKINQQNWPRFRGCFCSAKESNGKPGAFMTGLIHTHVFGWKAPSCNHARDPPGEIRGKELVPKSTIQLGENRWHPTCQIWGACGRFSHIFSMDLARLSAAAALFR